MLHSTCLGLHFNVQVSCIKDMSVMQDLCKPHIVCPTAISLANELKNVLVQKYLT